MPSLADIPDAYLEPPAPQAFKQWLIDARVTYLTAMEFMYIFAKQTGHNWDPLDRNQVAQQIQNNYAREE